MRNSRPTETWIKRAFWSFDLYRNKKGCVANRVFLSGLYSQGYTAKQAGKLAATLALCEESGDLKPFDYFNA